MDFTTLNTNTVTILRPNGQRLILRSVSLVGLNRYRFAFDPQTLTGRYQVLIGSTAKDRAGNLLDQDQDGNAGEPAEDVYSAAFNLVAVDLQLSNVSVDTNQLWAGQTVTATWTGRNVTGGPLLGDWSDAVYLSSDARWDINDVRLAIVPHSGGLAQNSTYSAASTLFIPNALPGSYYLLLRADVFDQEKESGNEANNLTAFGPLPLRSPMLVADGGPLVSELRAPA